MFEITDDVLYFKGVKVAVLKDGISPLLRQEFLHELAQHEPVKTEPRRHY